NSTPDDDAKQTTTFRRWNMLSNSWAHRLGLAENEHVWCVIAQMLRRARLLWSIRWHSIQLGITALPQSLRAIEGRGKCLTIQNATRTNPVGLSARPKSPTCPAVR